MKTLMAAERVVLFKPASGPKHPGSSVEIDATDLHSGVQKVRQHMHQDLETRFHWDKPRATYGIASLLDPRFKTLSDYHVPYHHVEDARKVLHQELDTAITKLEDADMYSSRGEKRDAGDNVVVDNSDPFASENTASRSSAISAFVFLGNIGHGDGRFVLGAVTDELRNIHEVNRDWAAYIQMPVEKSTS